VCVYAYVLVCLFVCIDGQRGAGVCAFIYKRANLCFLCACVCVRVCVHARCECVYSCVGVCMCLHVFGGMYPRGVRGIHMCKHSPIASIKCIILTVPAVSILSSRGSWHLTDVCSKLWLIIWLQQLASLFVHKLYLIRRISGCWGGCHPPSR